MQRSRPLLRIRIIFLLITAAFIIFTVGAVVLFLMNVRIQTVTVENCVYSDEQSIISAAGIKKGTHSYAIDKEEIAKSIKEKNSYVSDVRVKRTGPTSLVLILTEDPPCFRTLYENRYLVLSAGLRVLDEYSIPIEGYSTAEIFGNSVDRAVDFDKPLSELAGRTVKFEFTMSDAEIFSMTFEE